MTTELIRNGTVFIGPLCIYQVHIVIGIATARYWLYHSVKPVAVMMTSAADYLEILPDYDIDDANRQYQSAGDDDDRDDDDDAKMKSRNFPETSLYEHPRPSETAGTKQQQQSTYERVITSQRLPGNDLQLMTSDMTYDEIVDIPAPPPLRSGW